MGAALSEKPQRITRRELSHTIKPYFVKNVICHSFVICLAHVILSVSEESRSQAREMLSATKHDTIWS